MPFFTKTSKAAGVLGAAALALTLTACAGGQSVADACLIAEKTVAEANTEMDSLLTEALSGEGSMKDIFAPLNAALADAQKEISNAEVSDALKNVSTEFTKMTDLLGDFKLPNMADLDMTDPAAMAEFEAFEAEMTAMADKLEAASESMTESGEKLQELCGI